MFQGLRSTFIRFPIFSWAVTGASAFTLKWVFVVNYRSEIFSAQDSERKSEIANAI